MGHVARTCDRTGAYRVLVWIPQRDLLEDLGIDGRIILNGLFKKWDKEARTALHWLKVGAGGGCL